MLTAPYSQTPCVWFRVEITHHHYREDRGPGDRLEVERLFALHSHEPFTLVDETGSVLCAPDWADVDDAEISIDEFIASEKPPSDILSPAQLAAVGEGTDRKKCTSTTVLGPAALIPGCTYKEWVIRPGQELFVGGLIRRDDDGAVVIEGTEEEPVNISTHTEEEQISADWNKELVGFGLLPVSLILLATLLILL
nr:GIDE domain-containing protein [Nocardiopsis mwathae]